MPISVTDYYKLDKTKFDKFNALDVILDRDSLFFIDPLLARHCTVKEFANADVDITKYFSNIIVLLNYFINNKNQVFFNTADEKLTFKEIKGTCLGYTQYGTDGNAIGPEIREKILTTLVDLIKAGETDPVVFELIGIFQKGVGCDRISDLLTYILEDNIFQYSHNIFSNFEKIKKNSFKNNKYLLPINQFNNSPVLLLPKTILRPLPIAFDFEDIDRVCQENTSVRSIINKYLGNILTNYRKKLNKKELYSLFMSNIPFRESLIKGYKKASTDIYNFNLDPKGEIIWYEAAKEYIYKKPLYLSSAINVEKSAKEICNHFKHLIEDNGLWKLLYDQKTNPKHEEAAQLLFFGISSKICEINDIDLSREINNGRGPVDFKLSIGQKNKLLIETKLSSNKNLITGFTTQLKIYMKQENSDKAIYLIIRVESADKNNDKRVDEFIDIYNKLSEDIKKRIQYIIIDGTPKLSATKEKFLL